MPEKSIYITKLERDRFFEHIVAQGFSITVDRNYPTPVPFVMRELYVVRDWKSSDNKYDGQFFITHEKWNPLPFEILSTINSGKCVYFISPRDNGPSIQIGSMFSQGRVLAVSVIAHYPFYYNSQTHEKIKPPQHLLDSYRDMVKFLTKDAEAVKLTHRKYWMSRAAMTCGIPLGPPLGPSIPLEE